MKTKGAKVLITFHLRDMPEGIPSDDPALAAPPHWRLEDPKGGIICWGHRNTGTFESMVALLRVAAIGARKATRDELVEAGVIVVDKPKLWTPDDGGDDTRATHIGETGGFFDGKRHTQEEMSNGN